MDLVQSFAGNGNAAVDRGMEAKVPVAGAARSECPDAIQVDDVFPMTLHEGRGRDLFSQLV